MPVPTCATCTNPRVQEIDAAILAGKQISKIAREFNGTRVSVARHRDMGHVRGLLRKQGRPKIVPEPSDTSALAGILALIAEIQARDMVGASQVAQSNRDRELRLAYEALGKMQGPAEPPEFDPSTSKEWIELRVAILTALLPYPEAHAAVDAAIRRTLEQP